MAPVSLGESLKGSSHEYFAGNGTAKPSHNISALPDFRNGLRKYHNERVSVNFLIQLNLGEVMIWQFYNLCWKCKCTIRRSRTGG